MIQTAMTTVRKTAKNLVTKVNSLLEAPETSFDNPDFVVDQLSRLLARIEYSSGTDVPKTHLEVDYSRYSYEDKILLKKMVDKGYKWHARDSNEGFIIADIVDPNNQCLAKNYSVCYIGKSGKN